MRVPVELMEQKVKGEWIANVNRMGLMLKWAIVIGYWYLLSIYVCYNCLCYASNLSHPSSHIISSQAKINIDCITEKGTQD